MVFFLGSYGKHSKAIGQLVPQNGLIQVINPNLGRVSKKLVSEGDKVEIGQLLYVFNDQRISASGDNMKLLERDHLRIRIQNIEQKIAHDYIYEVNIKEDMRVERECHYAEFANFNYARASVEF